MMSKRPEIGVYLDDEEASLIEALENGATPLGSVLTAERRAELEAMARTTFSEDREKISLRVPRSDLARLKSRALQEGIPYQTLINSIIHKYVSS
ncbi:CopG family antitoxin [Pararhizobium sp. DWP3-4]|uniref:CopG family antitoxin n=1 Tax=Pararhizobium sp. DWP3-4 TaxID=2804565 RepID=UPI003CEF8772